MKTGPTVTNALSSHPAFQMPVDSLCPLRETVYAPLRESREAQELINHRG